MVKTIGMAKGDYTHQFVETWQSLELELVLGGQNHVKLDDFSI